MADAAGAFPAMADGVLVVSPLCPAAAVPHHPRCGADDRPRAVGPLETAERRHPRQPVGQGAGGRRLASASTARKKSSDASGTSPSTRMAAC